MVVNIIIPRFPVRIIGFHNNLFYFLCVRAVFFSTVPPMIWIQNQLVGAQEGQSVTLECTSEAYPKSIDYWTKDKTTIISNGQYIIYRLENIVHISTRKYALRTYRLISVRHCLYTYIIVCVCQGIVGFNFFGTHHLHLRKNYFYNELGTYNDTICSYILWNNIKCRKLCQSATVNSTIQFDFHRILNWAQKVDPK